MIFRAKSKPRARVKIKITRANGKVEYVGSISYNINVIIKRMKQWLQYMYKMVKK